MLQHIRLISADQPSISDLMPPKLEKNQTVPGATCFLSDLQAPGGSFTHQNPIPRAWTRQQNGFPCCRFRILQLHENVGAKEDHGSEFSMEPPKKG